MAGSLELRRRAQLLELAALGQAAQRLRDHVALLLRGLSDELPQPCVAEGGHHLLLRLGALAPQPGTYRVEWEHTYAVSSLVEDMRRTWVLDTETKGTGANMVPLEKVQEKRDARPERASRPARRPQARKPRPGRASQKPVERTAPADKTIAPKPSQVTYSHCDDNTFHTHVSDSSHIAHSEVSIHGYTLAAG